MNKRLRGDRIFFSLCFVVLIVSVIVSEIYYSKANWGLVVMVGYYLRLTLEAWFPSREKKLFLLEEQERMREIEETDFSLQKDMKAYFSFYKDKREPIKVWIIHIDWTYRCVAFKFLEGMHEGEIITTHLKHVFKISGKDTILSSITANGHG